MKLYILLALLCGCIAVKEEPEEYTKYLSNGMIKEIVKRLMETDIGSDEDSQSDTGPQCTYTVDDGTIIRTKDSINNGAKFLNDPSVKSQEACIQQCCDTDSCNTAIFKGDEDDNACYLFQCGHTEEDKPQCMFVKHPGYWTVQVTQPVLNPDQQLHRSQQEMHADQLAELASTSTTSTTTTTTTTTTPQPTTTATTTTTTTTEAPSTPHLPVPLFGKCHIHKDCAGSATVCMAGYCVCQEEYEAQEGLCTPKKPAASKVKEPTDKTGGYKQGVHVNQHETQPDQPRPQPQQPHQQSQQQPEDIPQRPVQQVQPVVHRPKQQHPKPAPQEVPVHTQVDTVDKLDNQPSEVDSSQQDNTDVEDKAASSKIDVPASSKIDVPASSKIDVAASSKIDIAISDNSEESKAPELPGDTEVHIVSAYNESQADQLRQAVMEEDDQTVIISRSNKGAVIALSLGLVISALLLFFVGCRLRTVKKRLRRGRPLNSNEADYLINGMYL